MIHVEKGLRAYEGVYQAISLEKCVGGRRVLGGPAPENVRFQARRVLELVGKE